MEKTNCYFEDNELRLNTKLVSPFIRSSNGYFIHIIVSKRHVIELLKHDIVATYNRNGYFYLVVRLTNNTTILLNGFRITDLTNPTLQHLDYSKIAIKELAMKQYSAKTENKQADCYALRLILSANIPKIQKRMD